MSHRRRRRVIGLALIACACIFVGAAGAALAHGGPPLRLALHAVSASSYAVVASADEAGETADPSWLVWPEDCAYDPARRFLSCDAPVEGRAIDGSKAPTNREILIVVARDGVASHVAVVSPQAPVAVLRGRAAPAAERGFFVAGIVHVLGGWDHVAFVALLAAVATSVARLLHLVTGFTVGHAASFVAAALVRVEPSALVEVAIAASIVVLARDLASGRGHAGGCASVVTGFGLVHGLGFAGGLASATSGLAQGGWLPLVAFNLGIEAGQIVVVVPIFVAFALLRRHRHDASVRRLLAYAAGTAGFAAAISRLEGIVQ